MPWAPDYATTGELRDYLRISSTADDAVLEGAIAAASRAIDQWTNRQFGSTATTEARYYTALWSTGRRRWIIPIDDTPGTDVTVALEDDADDWATALTAYRLEPANAAAIGRPYTELTVATTAAGNAGLSTDHGAVEVTATWGWAAVPDAIHQATLLQASRIVQRREAPFGIAGSPDAGSEMRLLERLDPDVAVAARPFRRVWGAA